MVPSANFNAFSNIVFLHQEKGTFYGLEIQTKSARLKYSTPLIQSEIIPVPSSTDDCDTRNTLKE